MQHFETLYVVARLARGSALPIALTKGLTEISTEFSQRLEFGSRRCVLTWMYVIDTKTFLQTWQTEEKRRRHRHEDSRQA